MTWTAAFRVFMLKRIFMTGDSAIAAQRAFRAHHRNDAVPYRKSILLWVENLGPQDQCLKERHLEGLELQKISRL